jgi:RNA polymerase sigma factor (sigma-70 family)
MEEYMEVKISTREDFKVNLTPEYIKSLNDEERNSLRSELYQYPQEGLNYELFDRLSNVRLLEVDNSNGEVYKYKGDFKWNIDGVEELLQSSNINTEGVKKIINPKDNITYYDAEAFFNGNPNLLLASMTLMAKNYESLFSKIDSDNIQDLELEDINFLKTNILFTDEEEVIFLTGRTLLKEFNRNSPNMYVHELIDDIDSVITRTNTGLIWDIVKKYAHVGEYEELFQTGSKGIFRALKKFDINENNKFSTYAIWWIRHFITRYMKDNYSIIKIPVYMHDTIKDFKNAKRKLKHENGEEPTDYETLEYLKENGKDLPAKEEFILEAVKHSNVYSLEENLNNDSDDEYTLYQYIADSKSSIDKDIELFENRELISQLYELANLDETEISLLNLMYGLIPSDKDTKRVNHTQNDIASILNLSKGDVSKIRDEALEKLRSVLNK